MIIFAVPLIYTGVFHYYICELHSPSTNVQIQGKSSDFDRTWLPIKHPETLQVSGRTTKCRCIDWPVIKYT